MGKKRTLQQKYSKLSEGKLQIKLCDWVINPLTEDFGLDFDIAICDDFNNGIQEVTSSSFYLQLKSTVDSCVSHPFHDTEVRDLTYFLNQHIPVVLMKYYEKCDSFYWVIIHSYIWDYLNKEDLTWKNKEKKRIKLLNKLDDIAILKSCIIDVQKRIARHKIFSMEIGEGLRPEEIGLYRKKSLEEYKFSSLIMASDFLRSGEFDKAIETYEEVFSTPGEDGFKINATLNIIFQLNSLNPDNHEKILKYSNFGIALAEKLDALNYSHLFKILKYEVILIKIIVKLTQILYAKKYDSKYGDGIFALFYEEDAKILNSEHQKIIKMINDSLCELMKYGFVSELIISLSVLIGTITFQIQKFNIVDSILIKSEEKNRTPLISFFTALIESEKDANILQFCYFKLGSYYYWSGNPHLAQEYLELAIESAEKIGSSGHVEGYKQLLAEIEKNPNPAEIKCNNESSHTISLKEYQAAMRIHLESLGVDFNNPDDEYTKAIYLGLKDVNPTEYLKYCENLRISYITTSLLGSSIALHSLGMKAMWCKFIGGASGLSLETLFQGFLQRQCQGCSKRIVRSDDWECTIDELKEINDDPEFQKFIDKMMKSI